MGSPVNSPNRPPFCSARPGMQTSPPSTLPYPPSLQPVVLVGFGCNFQIQHMHQPDVEPTSQAFIPCASSQSQQPPYQQIERQHKPVSKTSPGPHLPPSQVPCKFFNRGFCNRGASCWFKHDVNLFLQKSPDVSLDSDSEAVSSIGCNTNIASESCTGDKRSIDDRHSDGAVIQKGSSEICSICFEIPELYGILESCDHVFCLECIRSWRSSNSSSGQARSGDPTKVSKTCPCCRIPSKYIIPSSVFPSNIQDSSKAQGLASASSNAATKNAIVANYLSQMKRIPCRYFQASIERGIDKPSCPFANECHYAHVSPISGEDYIFTESELRGIKRKASKARQSRNGRESDVLRALLWEEFSELGPGVPMPYNIDAMIGWLAEESLLTLHSEDTE